MSQRLQNGVYAPDISANIFIFSIIIIFMDSDEQRHDQLGHFSNAQMGNPLTQSAQKGAIIIGLCGHESRGSALKKHTVYLIKGQDKNGQFQVWRRFNEFHQMRQAMRKAWPGCLIPSLPSKNPIMKNQEEMNRKRQRYLNDFLKKMTLRPYLYYSEQFQALLRSQESNLSDTFSKWPTPSSDSIIIRYKEVFSVLAGKQINNTTVDSIFRFYQILQKNKDKLIQYRKVVKELAFQRDRYNKYYLQFFKAAKRYEETIMVNYTNPQKLLYCNPQNKSLHQHQTIIQQAVAFNPYWLLYDLIKNEERDGRAFEELLKTIESFADRAHDVQHKIESNVKGISQASSGKKNLKTLTMKGTPDEIKYQLQVENQNLKKQKQVTQSLRDIVVALVCFIEIQQYKSTKKQFYLAIINKLSTFDQNFAKVTLKIWEQLQTQLQKLVESVIA